MKTLWTRRSFFFFSSSSSFTVRRSAHLCTSTSPSPSSSPSPSPSPRRRNSSPSSSSQLCSLPQDPKLQPKIEFLSSLGLSLVHIARLGRLLTAKLDTLQSRLSYLTSIGITARDTSKIIRRYPYVLGVNSHTCIKPALQYLQNQRGLPRETICKLVVSQPRLICYSTPKIAQKLEFFEKLGLDANSHRFLPLVVKLCTLSRGLIQQRFNWLMSQGMSREEVITIMELAPTVFACRQEIMERKIDYLLNVLNRDIQELPRYPIFLAMSLEKRIKPRFSVVDQLVERGVSKTYSLAAVLSCTANVFQKRFTDKLYPEETTERLEPGRRKRGSIQKPQKGRVAS